MLIQEPHEFARAMDDLSEAKTVIVDTETTWTDRWHERKLLGISLYIPNIGSLPTDVSYYLPYRHCHDQSLFGSHNLDFSTLTDLDQAFKRQDLICIFHNAKFDLQVLRRAGVHIENRFYCTMLMSHMVNENSRHSLELLASHYLGKGKDKDIKKVADACGGWEKIPPEAMGKYAERDVEATWGIYKFLRDEMDEQELMHLWNQSMNFCRFLADVESRGVAVDRFKIEEYHSETVKRMDEIQEKLGIDPMKPAELAKKLFQDMGLAWPQKIGGPTKQFPFGRPSMDENTLLKYGDVEEVKLVLEYRGLLKAKSTWLEPFLVYSDTDGRLHPNFNQHGTKTTRLSCSNPNMQQIPRDERSSPVPVKKILAASEGFALIEFDYSQIELRLAAAFAQEESMLITLREGGDIHQLTANLCDIDRHGGKTLNFAMIYGAGSGKIAELLHVSLEEGRNILQMFHSAYPKLKSAADLVQMKAEERMFIRYWNGRRRHFENTYECHKAFNSWVQGGAAQIMEVTALNLYKQYDESASRVVGLVHDSVWVEIKLDEINEEVFRIKQVMETWPMQKFGVPFPCDWKRLA